MLHASPILGRSQMVRQRTLDPPFLVRVQAPQHASGALPPCPQHHVPSDWQSPLLGRHHFNYIDSVGITTHSGCAISCAARSLASRVANNPKTVAPLPDIAAADAPTVTNASTISRITG